MSPVCLVNTDCRTTPTSYSCSLQSMLQAVFSPMTTCLPSSPLFFQSFEPSQTASHGACRSLPRSLRHGDPVCPVSRDPTPTPRQREAGHVTSSVRLPLCPVTLRPLGVLSLAFFRPESNRRPRPNRCAELDRTTTGIRSAVNRFRDRLSGGRLDCEGEKTARSERWKLSSDELK